MKQSIVYKETKKNTFFKFRHDIEILRGFSVIIVLLYHFNFNLIDNNFIRSGYIGVDIFFIISGYIITKILLENEKITIKEFYIKRFKRLIPVLTFVIFIFFLISIFLFDLFLVKKNINSIYSVFFGVSNFFFWLTSTIYQFAEKNSMLFLHTWSLAIEFQFYIFFPILIFFLNKKFIPYVLLIFLSLSYISIFYLYQKHNLFNFYFSFSRVFEILSGSLACIYENKIKNIIKEKYHTILYFTGLVLIFIFMLYLHDGDNHPNPQSIFFVIGTCLMIIFYNKKIKFLHKYNFEYIGTISYSLYLWHFPIIVVASFYFSKFGDFEKLFAFIICIIISIFSYSIIEKRFRIYTLSKNLFFVGIIASIILILSIITGKKEIDNNKLIMDNYFLADQSNIFLENSKTFSLRKNKNIFSFKDDYINYSPQFSNSNKIKILFLGDSHSKDIFNLFYTHKDFYSNYEFARYGFNLKDIFNNRKKNLIISETFKKANIIVLSIRYNYNDLSLIDEFYKILNSYNKKLIIVLKKPEFAQNNKRNKTFVDQYIISNKKYTVEDVNLFSYEKLNKAQFEKINSQLKKKYEEKVTLFDIYPLICSDEERMCSVMDDKKKKNFYDYGHFTLSGSRYFGKKIIESKVYEKIFNIKNVDQEN